MKKGWEIKKLLDIANVTTGKWDANHATQNGKYRFYTCAYDYLYCNTKRFSGESLILPGNGVNVGEVFFYNGDFDAYQRTYVITGIKIMPKYLYYHMLLHWKELGTKKQYGSATNFIKMGNFQDYFISFPESIPEQKRIVSILDKAFADIEKAKVNAEKNLQNSKELFESYLQSVFSNKGDEWEVSTIGQTCNLQTGGTPDTKKVEYYKDGKIRWLVSGDINKKNIIDCDGRITELGLANSNAKYLPLNSVLIALNGQGKTRGTVAMLRTKATCNQSLVSIYPKDDKVLLPEFIFANLEGRYREIRRMTGDSGNDRRGLNMPLIRSIEFSYPKNISEQKKIIKKLDELSTETKKLEGVYEQKLKDLEELKKSILQKAFNGEL